MRKIKEVLRLKYQCGLTERQIARSCSLARSTVAEYLMRARAAGISWPLPPETDEAAVEARLFPSRSPEGRGQKRPLPDFAQMHKELQSHKHLTLQLLWEEYKQTHPDGYQYSQYCESYRSWEKKLDMVLRQTHRGGEKLFVDYAGDTVPVVNPQTGSIEQATIFVAVLGASNYTYADATLKGDLESWIGSHVRTFEYLGGCPAACVPDNLKAGVKQPNRYEPDLNPAYQEMALHYGVAVIPARVRKPRDKAKAEAGVLVVERWILAALRKRTFFSLAELNQAIRELLEKLNTRGFRKMPGSRRELFEQTDRPALKPLPVERFQFAQWKWSRVSNDYHVELDHHFYSVPSNLLGRKVEIRYTTSTVEVFYKGVRVASHARSSQERGVTTVEAHRPQSHRRYLEWNWPRLSSWASNAGPSTQALVEQVFNNAAHREQGLRVCVGLVRLGDCYGEERLESACARAIRFNACSYKSVASILKAGLDRSGAEPPPQTVALAHDNIRGAEYFDQPKEGCHVN